MIGSNNRCVCHMLKKKMGDWEKKGEFKIQAVVCFLLLVYRAGRICVCVLCDGQVNRAWFLAFFVWSLDEEIDTTQLTSFSCFQYATSSLQPATSSRHLPGHFRLTGSLPSLTQGPAKKGIESSSQRRVKKGFFRQRALLSWHTGERRRRPTRNTWLAPITKPKQKENRKWWKRRRRRRRKTGCSSVQHGI
jgi:hypothetical protein